MAGRAKTTRRAIQIKGYNIEDRCDAEGVYQGVEVSGVHYIICSEDISGAQESPDRIYQVTGHDSYKNLTKVRTIRDKKLISDVMIAFADREVKSIDAEVDAFENEFHEEEPDFFT